MTERYKSYRDFFPYYLSEHSKPLCRAFHYVGTTLVLAVLAYAIFMRQWAFLALMPVAGYSFAWVGHFFVEKNRPATFTYPIWSLMGDFHMYFLWLTGRLKSRLKQLR